MLNPGSKIKNIEIESFIGEGGVTAIPAAIIGGLIGYAAPHLVLFVIVFIVILFLFNT